MARGKEGAPPARRQRLACRTMAAGG